MFVRPDPAGSGTDVDLCSHGLRQILPTSLYYVVTQPQNEYAKLSEGAEWIKVVNGPFVYKFSVGFADLHRSTSSCD